MSATTATSTTSSGSVFGLQVTRTVRDYRAILFVDRRDAALSAEFATAPELSAHRVPAAWSQVLANVPLIRVFEQLLSEVGVEMAGSLVPREVPATELKQSPAPVFSFNGQLKLAELNLPASVGQSALAFGHDSLRRCRGSNRLSKPPRPPARLALRHAPRRPANPGRDAAGPHIRSPRPGPGQRLIRRTAPSSSRMDLPGRGAD